jgi:gluconate 2-dehydrogenase gamma chain
METIGRRALFAGTAILLATHTASARVIRGALPWTPNQADPPTQVTPGPWTYFTPEEGATVEALVDRLIPPDPDTPGGKDAGCAVFIDRQLAGPYGASRGLYMRPPFRDGTPQQGMQSPLTPAARYRVALAALDAHCKSAFVGKPFAQLSPDQQDKILHGLESSELQLSGTSGLAFFELLWTDTQQGFLADPIYGGNKDMAGWKMIGFPGARYDYRDWISRHNEPYPHPPVGIGAHPDWTP